MRERSFYENPPPVTPRASVRLLQKIRAKVQAGQRPGADPYLDPGIRMRDGAKLTVVVRKVWWSATLEESSCLNELRCNETTSYGAL